MGFIVFQFMVSNYDFNNECKFEKKMLGYENSKI